MDNSPEKESPDAVKQLRALADDKVEATCAYAPDLRRAADEIERLRRVFDAAQFQCDICGDLAVDAVDGWGRCRDHIDYDPYGN